LIKKINIEKENKNTLIIDLFSNIYKDNDKITEGK
jgi:hypothetical protein